MIDFYRHGSIEEMFDLGEVLPFLSEALVP